MIVYRYVIERFNYCRTIHQAIIGTKNMGVFCYLWLYMFKPFLLSSKRVNEQNFTHIFSSKSFLCYIFIYVYFHLNEDNKWYIFNYFLYLCFNHIKLIRHINISCNIPSQTQYQCSSKIMTSLQIYGFKIPSFYLGCDSEYYQCSCGSYKVFALSWIQIQSGKASNVSDQKFRF